MKVFRVKKHDQIQNNLACNLAGSSSTCDTGATASIKPPADSTASTVFYLLFDNINNITLSHLITYFYCVALLAAYYCTKRLACRFHSVFFASG